MAGKAKAGASSRAKKKSVTTDQAIEIDEDQQWKALCDIAFGESWEEFRRDINKRIEGYQSHEPIVQSTNRALDMIKSMMFERL